MRRLLSFNYKKIDLRITEISLLAGRLTKVYTPAYLLEGGCEKCKKIDLSVNTITRVNFNRNVRYPEIVGISFKISQFLKCVQNAQTELTLT